MERLNQDLKTKNFQHLYLLYGDETYLRKNYKDMLKNAIIGDDTMNFTYYEGKDIDVESLIDQAETMPFFAEKRLVLVENSGFFKNGNERMQGYISNMPDYLYLIFVEKEVDKRTSIFKAVKSKGSAVEMQPYTPDKMKLWIGRILKENGKIIREKDMEYLLRQTGTDMVNIKTELEKLISYVGDSSEINKEDIDAIVTRQITDTIFEMIKAIGEQKRTAALNLYFDLLKRREAPAKILALIERQFNLLLQAKELLMLKYTNANIASKIGVNPYFINEYVGQARNFDYETLRIAFEECIKTDESIKTGRIKDQLAIELLIIALADKKLVN